MRLALVLVVLVALVNLSFASPPAKRFYVDVGHPRAAIGGTCSSPQVPCRRISDALERARALRAEGSARPIEIVIAHGLYRGVYGTPGGELEDLPLLVNVPDVTLRGETVLLVDDQQRPQLTLAADETPTFLDPAHNTVISGPAASADNGVILVLPTRDLVTGAETIGDRAVIEGLTLAANGQAGIGIDRAAGVVVRGNAVYRAYNETINTSASFEGNLLMSSGSAALLINVADLDHPHEVIVRNNRMVQNALGGIYVGATGYRHNLDLGVHAAGYSFTLPTLHDQHFGKILIENNDISGHTGANLGFAVRLAACDDGQGTFPEVAGELEVTIRDNDFIDNNLGVAVDGGWPRRNQHGSFVARISVALSGNQISGRRFDGLATFGRLQAARNTALLSTFKYVERSTFTIIDPDGDLGSMGVDNLAVDPLSGTALGNTLWINGSSIAAPSRSCSLPSLASTPYPPTTPCVLP